MQAETAQKFEALEQLAAKLREVFTKAGFEPVAPAILQPADVLLDCSGEALRARTYVFSDLDGHELCLRPDLTVPTARLYLERNPTVHEEARYCYNGPTFRYSPADGKNTRPREFRQMGLELYAMNDRLAAEAEIFKLTIESIEKARLSDYKIKIGDLGLFTAFIDAIDMPTRWRARLKHHFWRPDAFHKLLRELSGDEEGASQTKNSWPLLDSKDLLGAMLIISNHMRDHKIPLIGTRSLEEVTKRLIDRQLDTAEDRLSKEKVQLIEDYLAIQGPPRAAMARIVDLTDKADIKIAKAFKRFEKRLDLFKERGIEMKNTEFSAEFGRSFEYYTGFVFQIEASNSEEIGPVAGGGRYDGLLKKLGAMDKVRAVGCAIHTERLLTLVEGEME
ncbi:MAG: ATP phosphoribosyltransferase regulatory subunit [bacterium]|nr:ATP phosphoribosyltransferase regulatory subunit [bacterium]